MTEQTTDEDAAGGQGTGGQGTAGQGIGSGATELAANQNDGPLIGLVDGFAMPHVAFEADAALAFDPEPEKSRLDLADVLTGAPASSNIDGYLLAISHGESSTLLVDTDGGGNFTSPDLVLEISGVDWDSGTAGQLADLVNDSIILVV